MLELMPYDQCPPNRMSIDDAIMYCFCLGDGWRLPTDEELKWAYEDDYYFFSALWIQEHIMNTGSLYTRFLRPVRDVDK